MMIKPKLTKLTLGTILTLVLTGGLVACQPNSNNASSNVEGPGGGEIVHSAHSSLLEERFQTEVVNIGMEKLGYKVATPKEIEYATIFVALSNGSIDYMTVYWEKIHQKFYESAGGEQKLQPAGVLVDNTVIGYQIDKKSADKYNITNIEQLKDPDIAKIFDTDGDGKANLTGCNAGWNCQQVIDHHIKTYGLEDTVEQDAGNYSVLIADTIARYQQGEPVLYYAWTPYWMGAVLKPGEDVVWLEVPYTSLPEGNLTEKETTVNGKNLGFAVDRMRILSNKQFLDNNPAAKRFFELVKIPIGDINAQNQLMQEGEDKPEDIRRHAEEWIEKNQELFNSWLEEARKAGASSS